MLRFKHTAMQFCLPLSDIIMQCDATVFWGTGSSTAHKEISARNFSSCKASRQVTEFISEKSLPFGFSSLLHFFQKCYLLGSSTYNRITSSVTYLIHVCSSNVISLGHFLFAASHPLTSASAWLCLSNSTEVNNLELYITYTMPIFFCWGTANKDIRSFNHKIINENVLRKR